MNELKSTTKTPRPAWKVIMDGDTVAHIHTVIDGSRAAVACKYAMELAEARNNLPQIGLRRGESITITITRLQ